MHEEEHDIVALFREHAGRVEQLLRRFGVAERDVADATQEVFVVVHRKLSEFEGRASISTWLYQICLRVAAAERRRARHRRELLGEDSPAPASEHDQHAELERRRCLEDIALALDELSEPQRTALVLHELEGLQVREIARRLRVPVKTAFSRLYAARAQLREQLRRQGYAVPAWLPIFSGGLWRARKPAAISGKAALAKMCFAAAFAICATLLTPHPVQRVEPIPPARAEAVPPTPQQQPPIAPPPVSAPAAKRAAFAQRASAPPVLAAPAPAAHASADELILVRTSAIDLKPTIEHPFAARLRSDTPSVPPMVAKLAPATFEFEY